MEDRQMHSFSAPIERFEMDGAWDYLAIPLSISDDLRSKKINRVQVVLQDSAPYASGLLPLGDGRLFLIISKQRQKEMGQFLGAWLQVEIWEDQSKYGMPVPEELQELFDFDPAIEKAFENLLPGKRRNYLHQIASAKTEPTRTKRVLKLLKDLGIQNVG